jgi:hypothetical protein
MCAPRRRLKGMSERRGDGGVVGCARLPILAGRVRGLGWGGSRVVLRSRSGGGSRLGCLVVLACWMGFGIVVFSLDKVIVVMWT